MPQITLPLHLTYETKKDVPVALVARSLLANESLVRESVKLIERLIDGSELQVRGIRVESVSNASPLKELLAVGIFFAFQEDLEHEVPALVTQLTGIEVAQNYQTILTVAVMLVAIAIIDQMMQRFFPGKDVTHLKADYEKKLAALSALSGKSGEEINALVEESYSNKTRLRLINAAINFFAPSARGGCAPIIGLGGHIISHEAIQEVPRDLDFLMNESQEVYLLEDVVVDIHRADRDSNKAGWRAIIDAVSSDKIRMELAPDIDPNALYGTTTIVGDVFVVEERNPQGLLVTKMYHLMRVKNDAQG